jgi:hypothetical protein
VSPPRLSPVLGSAQTPLQPQTTMVHMVIRLNKWWRVWLTLAVLWSTVVFAYGWMNLPRPQQMPHDPRLVGKLSSQAALILYATDAKAEPVQDASGLVWLRSSVVVRMANGARLTFPATASATEVSFVSSEYSRLLDAEATERSRAYLLRLAPVWLLPCVLLLCTGLAQGVVLGRRYMPPRRTSARAHQTSSSASAVATRNDTARLPVTLTQYPSYAHDGFFRSMLANQQSERRTRVTIA